MINAIQYTIKNLNKDKRLKQISKICNIYNVQEKNDVFIFTIQSKYKKQIDKLLIDNQVTILKTDKLGTFAFLKKTILRIGVIIPICLFAVFVLVLNGFVFNYSVMGNQLVSTEEVIEVLKQNGVSGVVKKNNINTAELENSLQDIDRVSLASVIIKGNTLIVNIKEKVYNPEYEEKGEFDSLKSEYNGIITEISVVQGTPLVKIGQTVKIGQELVAPYVIDTSGQQLAVKPMADIKADVFLTTVSQIPNAKLEMIDTGNYIVKKSISLFGIDIYSNKNECHYKNYRVEESVAQMSNNLLLPVIIKNITYIEQQPQRTQNFFETNKEQILKECQEKTRQLVGSCEIIKEEYKTITQIADLNQITYTVVVNKSIC